MKKIFLLLILSIITACGENLDTKSDNPNDPINIIDLYLDSDFTIDSFYGEKFTNQSNTLNYTANNINPTGQDANDIARDLRVQIIVRLKANNNINYILDDHKIKGSVESKLLQITFPVEISDIGGYGEIIKGTYAFDINFNDEALPPFNNYIFNLGDNLVIDSLGNKTFKRLDPLKYHAKNIDHEGKSINSIVSELITLIETSLKIPSNPTVNYTLGDRNIEGNIGAEKDLTIEIPVTATAKDYEYNTISSTYYFTIKFDKDNKSSFYLGDNFTIDNVDNQSFKIINGDTLIYEVYDVDPKFNDKAKIVTQLETAINIVDVNKPDIEFVLGDNDTIITHNKLTVKFPITITEAGSDSNYISGTYNFTINFREVETTVLDFNLGNNFTIGSVGEDKPFEATDPEHLKYFVKNVNHENQNNDTIAKQLEDNITEVYNAINNNNSTDDDNIKFKPIDTVITEYQHSLIVDIEVTLTALNDPSNNKTGVYTFAIMFKADPPHFKPSFYLGNSFTIDSSPASKVFTTIDPQSLIYNIDDIEKTDVNTDTITAVLEKAVKTELAENILITPVVGTPSKTTDTAEQIVVKIPIKITKTIDKNIVIAKGIYIFTINYKDETSTPSLP